MTPDAKVKILFGILIIFGLYILFKNQTETFAPVYVPYGRRRVSLRNPYYPYYPYFYYPSTEAEYQNFLFNRRLEDYQLGIYETYD